MPNLLSSILNRSIPALGRRGNPDNKTALGSTNQSGDSAVSQNGHVRHNSYFKTLNVKKHEIRLVEIVHGEWDDPIRLKFAANVSLDKATAKYQALSYAVGSTHEVKQVTLEGQDLSIPVRLDFALRELRHFCEPLKRILVWVDRICINQADPQEKTQQAQLVQRIYRTAQHVIVSLGYAEHSREGAKVVTKLNAFHKYLAEEQASSATPPRQVTAMDMVETQKSAIVAYVMMLFDSSRVAESQGLEELCNSLYWEQLWAYQEFFVPIEDPVILWGGSFFSLVEMGSVGMMMNLASRDVHSIIRSSEVDKTLAVSHAQIAEATGLRNAEKMVQMLVHRTEWQKHPYTLTKMLEITRHLKCPDPRDHIFSILGLVSTKNQIVPDYRPSNTTSSVYQQAAMNCALRDANLDFLLSAKDESKQHALGLPSWTPDYAFETTHDYPGNATDLQDLMKSKGFHCMDNIPARVEFARSDEEATNFVMKVKVAMLTECIQTKHFLPRSRIDDGSQSNTQRAECMMHMLQERMETLNHNIHPASPEHTLASACAETVVFGYVHESLEAARTAQDNPSGIIFSKSYGPGLVYRNLMNAALNEGRWTLFALETGIMGWIVSTTKPGDRICFIPGCTVPIVLRPREEGPGFTNVGAAYVHGYMNGLAAEECKSGKLQYELVDIY